MPFRYECPEQLELDLLKFSVTHPRAIVCIDIHPLSTMVNRTVKNALYTLYET